MAAQADVSGRRATVVALDGGGAVAEAVGIGESSKYIKAGELAVDLTFDRIVQDVKAGFHARGVFVLPPDTFGPGAERLRDRDEGRPGIYGRKGLPPAANESVRYHMLLALRCAHLAWSFEEAGRPWCMVGGDVAPPEPTPLALPEVAAIAGTRKVQYLFVEEPADRSAPMVRVVFGGVAFRASGCDVLDCAFGRWLRARKVPEAPAHGHEVAESRGPRAASDRVVMTTKLRGESVDAKERREAEDADSLAGHRNTFDAVSRIEGHAKLGAVMADLCVKFLTECPELENLLLQLASGKLSRDEVKAAEEQVAPLVQRPRAVLGKVLGVKDVDPIRTGDCDTCIRGHILHRWAQIAGDPGADVCRWVWDGAGMGMAAAPDGAGAIFPVIPSEEQREGAPGDLDFGAAEGQNAIGAGALAGIESFQAKGWLMEYQDAGEVRRVLGADAVISAFHVLRKEKNGRVKRRLILDLKRSGVSRRTSHTRRIVLPRVSDAVRGALCLKASPAAEPHDVEWLVLDFESAFWNVPLHLAERKYFVGAAAGGIWGYQCAAQGSRNGPLAWAGPASTLLRCMQGTLNAYGANASAEARAQLYVDDPAIALSGSQAARDRMVVMIVLPWRARASRCRSRRHSEGQSSPGSGASSALTRTPCLCASTRARSTSSGLQPTSCCRPALSL